MFDIGGKSLVVVNMQALDKPLLTLGFFPMAKRQIPKTSKKINVKGLLFYVQEASFNSALVGTNFYNDFFVFGLAEAEAKQVSSYLVASTNLWDKNRELFPSTQKTH